MPISAGIYFQHARKRNSEASPSVVFIHGAGGTHLYWPANLRRLTGYNLYAVDLPGHGRSIGKCQDSIAAYAEAIIEWVRQLGLQKVILIGHSMGSAIALTLALEKPEQIVGIGLLGAAASLRVNPQILERIGQPDTYQDAVHKVVRWSFSIHTPQVLTALAEKRLLDAGPHVLYHDFLVCNAFDVTDQLAKISLPALVICGQDDKMTPVKDSLLLAEEIPGAECEVIPDAGHMVMLEKPHQVGSILEEFLSKI
ncbi:MAG TPA: alpha/beta hydrolase [Anaerolineales bacterium]|nr:alpha/beta hydrolase [Anaerolineales bacterium]